MYYNLFSLQNYTNFFRNQKIFCNFGFSELTFRSEEERKRRFPFLFSHLFRNFAGINRISMANDYFLFRQFTIHQARCAMKVGTDGTLLGAWAGHTDGGSILDVGTGTGLIALMMAQRFPKAHVVGIDIDAEAVSQARENVAISPFADRIDILQEDFNVSCPTLHAPFSIIVSNPPYFNDALKSPDAQRTVARHAGSSPLLGNEGGFTYRLLMQRTHDLLCDDGELSVIIPVSEQGRMESEAALAGLFKSRECRVKTAERKPPKRVLLAFRKHPTPLERTELVIGSEEYHKLTKDFYL